MQKSYVKYSVKTFNKILLFKFRNSSKYWTCGDYPLFKFRPLACTGFDTSLKAKSSKVRILEVIKNQRVVTYVLLGLCPRQTPNIINIIKGSKNTSD